MNDEHDPEFDEQILILLNQSWESATGIDDFSLRRDTTLAQMMKAYESEQLFYWVAVDSLDLMDLCYRLERDFAIVVTKNEWISLFGGNQVKTVAEWKDFQDEWTVQRLIDFLRERVTKVSFDAVNICGKDCAPAGAFIGLRDFVQRQLNSDIHMGPSSRVDEIVDRNAFSAFWKQLRLFSRNRTPQLIPRSTYRHEVLRFVYCWMRIYAVLISIGIFCAFAGMNCFWLIIPSMIANWIHWRILKDPDYGFLPEDMQTFRDLAEYIAKQPTLT